MTKFTDSLALPETDRRRFLLMALLLAITAAVYQHVCREAFVDWDDALHTYDNPYLLPLTPAHLARLWGHPYWGIYVPVSYLAYGLLAQVAPFRHPMAAPGGEWTVLNPHVFHTANLLLHLLNTLLVFELLWRIVKRDYAAFAGALLFAIHPIQVEAVAWISEMRGLLSGLFGLLALCQYLDYAEAQRDGEPVAFVRRRYLLALAAFALALLAKPSAAAIPFLAFVLDWGIVRRPLRRPIIALSGWLVAILPIIVLTQHAQPVPSYLHIPLWQRLMVAGDALAFYLSKLFLPVHLAIDYGRTPGFVQHNAVAHVTWAVPLLVGVLVWRWKRRWPLLAVAAGLSVCALLPELGLTPFYFQTYSTVTDRYFYLAMIGPALAVAWMVGQSRSRLMPIVLAACFLACVCLSMRQVTVWNDSRSLFEHAVTINPNSSKILYNLGNVYAYDGMRAEAINCYHAAIQLEPDAAEMHCNLGEALVESGHTAEGMGEMRQAIRLRPSAAVAHQDLGQVLADRGDTRGAAREWKAVLAITPDNAAIHFNLACALCRIKQFGEARRELEQVLRLVPDYTPAQQALRRLSHLS